MRCFCRCSSARLRRGRWKCTFEGSQLILTGPFEGFELTEFGAALTPAIKTVVFVNTGGGDFQAGLNLAAEIRRRGLTTVAQGYCRSSCANAFLGGVERRLADDQSYVAFHGHYDRRGATLHSEIGSMRSFYAEMTGGKVDDNLVQLWLHKPRAGMVYFFRDRTFNCNGDEPKRPSGCARIPQSALDQGIITSLANVEVNAELIQQLR